MSYGTPLYLGSGTVAFYQGTNFLPTLYKGTTKIWPTTDSLVSSWLTRISSVGGAAPSSTVQQSCKILLANLQGLGILPKIIRMNLFCAGDWKGSLVPLIVTSGIGLGYDYNGKYAPNSSTQGPFGASDWSLSTGFVPSTNANYVSSGNVAGNTSTNTLKIIDTTVPNNTAAIANYSVHMSCYISTTSTAGTITNNTSIGVITTAGNTYYFQPAYTGNSGTASRFNCYTQDSNSTAGGTVSTYTTPLGFYTGSRQQNNLSTLYIGTSIQPANPTFSVNPNTNTCTTPTLDSGTFMVFGRATSATYGVNKNISNLTDRGMYMYSIGTGLTQADVVNFNSVINQFNTSVGRTNY